VSPPYAPARATASGSVFSGASPTARSLENPVVKVAIAAPSVAALVYGVWTARIADLELFVSLVVAAMVLATVAVLRPWRGEQAERLERAWQLLSGTVGVGMAAPLLIAALETDVERFSLLFALVAVVGAYSYPDRLRTPLSAWLLLVWGATLWWGGIDDPARLALHLGGGLLILLTSVRTADALSAAIEVEAEARIEAEQRAHLLSSVLRTNSLRPEDVLDAVLVGLEQTGFDAVAIREHDVEAGTLRLVVGSPGMQELGLPPELPVERGGLSGLALRLGRPVVVDDYANHPAAIEPERPLRGVIAVPVEGDGRVRAVVLGARREGAVSAVQREAILLLSEQAGRALARASAFEDDRLTVADLRTLEVRTQDFVSTVSHELRTPLTVIHGLGQTLTRRWDDLDEDRRADLLGRIDANAERLSVMVRSLLDTSALEEGRLDLRPERLALRPLVDRLLHRLATVTAAHPVEVRIDPRLEIVADAGLFEHIVENLLTNVAKHTPQGTRVELSAQACGDRVRIEMRDDGPGIDPGDLPHVLDRFFRGGAPTRRTTGGLGLGLALARQIVQAHGGDLEVESSPGVGSTFRFEVAGATVSPGGPPSDGSPPARP
jgi:signal transduction histidine kinase